MKKMEKNSENADIKITVKFSGRSIPISTSSDTSIKELKSLLQSLTNVLPRGQKLIFKGKVLVDSMTLSASDVNNGAKLMLMASQGLHQGDGPVLKQAQSKPITRKTSNASDVEKATVSVDKTRLERWKATGVIALAECNLKAIPDEVWACGSSARVLDVSNNCIQNVPIQIGSMNSIQKLFLNANELSNESICWERLSSLKLLTVLSMSQNCMTALPSALGALSSLKQLDVALNKLSSLPSELASLTQLEVLKANNNRIISIPPSLGDCCSLIEVDLSSNHLSELPETLGNLRNLKTLHLANNGLKSLPSTLFKNCTELSTLDVHNTEITRDILCEFEGWEGFDTRRRLKHQKQLEFRVVGSAQFDEGADKS